MRDVIIIGAGLSGLTTAYYLNQKGISCLILEGRSRIGGRIYSKEGPLEMGATWMGMQHTHLFQLLNQLDIETFEQFTEGKISYEVNPNQPIQYFDMPPGQAPSYRIKGGTTRLIQTLEEKLDRTEICLDKRVKSIQDIGHQASVKLIDDTLYEAKQVILTIPPQLAEQNINFSPALPSQKSKLMSQTHTWMGESIKYGVTYVAPFWKDKGLSGMGFSQNGIIQEAHDHTNFEESYFAIKGFLNPTLKSLPADERKNLVISTLVRLFGKEAQEYLAYNEHVWQYDELTSVKEAIPVVPHQNNGHSTLREDAYEGKLIFSGTETSQVYAGYMDGAVYSGMYSAQKALQYYQDPVDS